MRKIFFAFTLLITSITYAQRVTKDTVFVVDGNNWNARMSYINGNTDSTEMFICLLGYGEVGTDASLNQRYLAFYWMNNGWDGNITLGNGVHNKVIYVTLQNPSSTGYAAQAWTSPAFDAIFSRFNYVKKNAAHLMVLSKSGEWGISYAVQERTTGDYTYIRRFKSIIDLSGMAPSANIGVTPSHPQRMGHWAKVNNAKILNIQQYSDGTGNNYRIPLNVNDSIPGNAFFIWSKFGDLSHCCFNEMVNPSETNYTASNTTKWATTRGSQPSIFIEGGQNVWQWALRQGDTTLPGGNTPPYVNAGADQTITLPTNSVSLSASASDNGSIASYAWTKDSGPTGSFSNSAVSNPTFTAGGAGTYLLKLRVTDNLGLFTDDYVTVTVNPIPGNQPPTVNVTAPGAITSPANSLTLTASASDADGTIASHFWRLASDAAYTIVSPTNYTTDITGLPIGASVVYFVAYDDDGDSTRVSVPITVLSASSGQDVAIKVALSPVSASKAVADPSWNLWTFTNTGATSNVRSQAFTDEAQGTTSVYATLTQSTSLADNTTVSGYPGTITLSPQDIVNYTSTSSQANRLLTIAGLDQASSYKLELFSTRYATSGSNTTNFIVNGETKSVLSTNNKTASVVYDLITPTDGQIVVTINRPNSFSYINGFILTELASVGGNLLPTANAGGNRFTRTSSITLNGSGADKDGTIASYAWTKLSGPSATLSGQTTANLAVSNLQLGTYVFELKVTDNDGGESKDEMTLNVLPERNAPPVANAGADTSIARPSITLTGLGTDVDGVITAYYWEQIAGPSAVSYNGQRLPSVVINNMLNQGVYGFTLQVTDDSSATAKDTVYVTVTVTTSIDCKAEAGENKIVPPGENSMTRLDGSASVGSNLHYSWRAITSVDFSWKGRLRRANMAKPYVMNLPYKDGGYNFELTVDNGLGCISKDTVNVFRQWGTPPPQGVDGTRSGHYATAADTLDINSRNGVGFARIGDWIIAGANTNSTGVGKTNIALSSEVKLGPGAKILIKGGKYGVITIKPSKDSVVGTEENPIIITNYDGQVQFNYMTIEDVVHGKLTGKYVPGVSGHVNYQGHAGGRYAFSRGTYGFYGNNEWYSLASVGLKIAGYYTNYIEVEYVEIGNGNFAGMQIKQDDRDEEMVGIVVHDCYVHDTHGEGIYIGSTKNNTYRHRVRDFKFYNNRVINAGNEIFQMNNQSTGNDVYNNAFINSATNWLSPFNIYQDNGWQGTYSNGPNWFRNNLALGMRNQGWNFYLAEHASQTPDGDTVFIHNNLFYQGSGRYGLVINLNNAPANLHAYADSLYFGGWSFMGDLVYAPAELNSQNSNILAHALGTADFKFRNIYTDGSKPTFKVAATLDTVNIYTQPIVYPRFKNSGWPVGFSYNNLFEYCDTLYDFWGDEANIGTTTVKRFQPVVYNQGDYALFMSKVYKSKVDNNSGNMPQGFTDEYWELQTWNYNGNTYTYPPDDYRLADDDVYKLKGMGLIDEPADPGTPPVVIPNQAPTIVSITPPITVTYQPGLSIRLTVEANDYDGTVVAYRWEKVAGTGPVIIRSESSNSTLIEGLEAGPNGTNNTLTFRVTVEDNKQATTEATVQVIVRPGSTTGPPKTSQPTGEFKIRFNN